MNNQPSDVPPLRKYPYAVKVGYTWTYFYDEVRAQGFADIYGAQVVCAAD